jgi:hypothetical protein
MGARGTAEEFAKSLKFLLNDVDLGTSCSTSV